MCSIVREHGNQLRAYASAALHLWESGQKKPAAWLLRRQGVALEEWETLEARDIFIHCLKPIYAYMEREDRRAAKLSQSDSVKLLTAPDNNDTHVSRDTNLETV